MSSQTKYDTAAAFFLDSQWVVLELGALDYVLARALGYTPGGVQGAALAVMPYTAVSILSALLPGGRELHAAMVHKVLRRQKRDGLLREQMIRCTKQRHCTVRSRRN